jgi:diguanylate cyclase (GGDEF)-like protein
MDILVVDDSRVIRELVIAYVEGIDHKAVGAKDGNEALELLHHQKFDLVMMDVEMPGINGFETTRRIRAYLGEQWIPIVFLSSNFSADHFVEGIDAGGDAYLPKPVNGPVLQSMVRAMGRIAVMQEKLAEANRELERLSQVDPLTNLMNRRGLYLAIGREWGRASREHSPLSLIMLDVDSFKPYNDNYGHLRGDSCLKMIAKAVQSALLRPADIVARYGGEEFVILLPGTAIEGAVQVAERVRQAVENERLEHAFSKVASYVTVSLGVASKGATEIVPDDLIGLADKRLYKAKESGRNRYVAEGD